MLSRDIEGILETLKNNEKTIKNEHKKKIISKMESNWISNENWCQEHTSVQIALDFIDF